jgi:competence protein ComEA
MWEYNKKQIIIMASAAAAVILISLIVAGSHHIHNPSMRKSQQKAKTPESPQSISVTDTNADNPVTDVDVNNPKLGYIYVHVTGEVKSPGVYKLKPGSRVKDAVNMAGGLKPNGDAESINMAQKLEDGEQVYIAEKGHTVKPPLSMVVTGPSASTPASSETTAMSETSEKHGGSSSGPSKLRTPGEGTVNINTAGIDELQRLPGVGPSTAQKILDYRTANGRFNSVDELDEVSGIGPAKLAKIRPFVRL